MLLNKHINSLVVYVLSILPCFVVACEFHGEPGFGKFSQFHPLMQMHYTDDLIQPLRLKHDRVTSIKSATPAILEIEYRLPAIYHDVVVRFSGSEGIEFLESREIPLQRLAGTYQLKYQAKKPGVHQISLQINAIKDDKPLDMVQRVEVHST